VLRGIEKWRNVSVSNSMRDPGILEKRLKSRGKERLEEKIRTGRK